MIRSLNHHESNLLLTTRDNLDVVSRELNKIIMKEMVDTDVTIVALDLLIKEVFKTMNIMKVAKITITIYNKQ